MSLAQDFKDISDRFRTSWTETGPITYDNSPSIDRPEKTISYHFAVRVGDEVRDTFGKTNAVYQRQGMVYLEINVPAGQGTLVGYEKADIFSAIFRNYRTVAIKCEEPIVDSADFDKGLWIIRVNVPYRSTRVF